MSAPASIPKRTRLKLWLVLFGVFVILCVLAYPFAKQTLPGEIIRSTIWHVPPAQLWADDLADDIRCKKRLAPLQDWSVQVLARYQSGQLATTGRGAFAGPFSADSTPKKFRAGFAERGGETIRRFQSHSLNPISRSAFARRLVPLWPIDWPDQLCYDGPAVVYCSCEARYLCLQR